MSELERIFNSISNCYADTREPIDGSDEFKEGPVVMAMDFEAFTQALTEVLKLVEVTDEEIEKECRFHRYNGYERKLAKWIKEEQSIKLEKLIK